MMYALIRYAGGLAWIGFVLLVVHVTLPEIPMPVEAASVSIHDVDVVVHAPQSQIDDFYQRSVRLAFGRCGDPCVVRNNPGGEIDTFMLAAFALQEGVPARGLVIDGPCASACAIAADIARAQTCITQRASFGFHQTNYGVEPPMSARLLAFIRAHGGFPSYDAELNWIGYYEARMFWRKC